MVKLHVHVSLIKHRLYLYNKVLVAVYSENNVVFFDSSISNTLSPIINKLDVFFSRNTRVTTKRARSRSQANSIVKKFTNDTVVYGKSGDHAFHCRSFQCISVNISVSFKEMVSILCERLIAKLIYWPPEAERQAVIERFKAKRQFPGTLGALDGSHIRIRKPAERSNDYFNRKGYYSVILQAVCREDKRFIDIYCGWPGKVHDARVYRNSPLSHRLRVLCGVNHIVADGAYPLTGNLLTPYRNNGHLTNQQQSYNTALSGTRVLIENAFGMLKNRFRRLQCIDMIDIEYIVKTITVACILHNLCILNKDDLPDELHANDNGDCDNCFGPNVNDTREGVLKRLLITRCF